MSEENENETNEMTEQPVEAESTEPVETENVTETAETPVEDVAETAAEPVEPVAEPSEQDGLLVQRDLSNAVLIEKRRQLEVFKLQKERTDRQIRTLEKHMDANLPTRLLQDAIERVKKNISERKIEMKDGTIKDATDSELEMMKFQLEEMEDTLSADEPMRDLRLEISTMKAQKLLIDSPDMQIPKLEKELKYKKEWITKARAAREGDYLPTVPTGVM